MAQDCRNSEQLLIDVTKRLPVLVVAREEWREQVSGWLKASAPEVPLVVLGKHMMFWERAEAQWRTALAGSLLNASRNLASSAGSCL